MTLIVFMSGQKDGQCSFIFGESPGNPILSFNHENEQFLDSVSDIYVAITERSRGSCS